MVVKAILADEDGLLPDSKVPGRLTESSLTASYLGYAGSDNGEGGPIVIVKPSGDTRPGVWELVHNGASGYMFHLVTGPNATTGGAIIGMGLGDGGASNLTGILISKKAVSTGPGIALVEAQGSQGSGLTGTQLSTAGTNAFVFLESANTSGVTPPLMRLVANGTPGASQILQEWSAPSVPAAGRVYADTGELEWETAAIRNRYGQVISDDGTGTQVALKAGKFTHEPAIEFVRYAGSAGEGFGGRWKMQDDEMQLQHAGNAAIGAHTWDSTTIRAKKAGGQANLAFFGTAPIAKPTVTGSRGGNAALASFLTQLAALGLITDGTSA